MVESSLFPYVFFSFIGFISSAPIILFLYYSYYKLRTDSTHLSERVDFLENVCRVSLASQISKILSNKE